MGKGFFSILVCLFFIFITNEVQGHTLSEKECVIQLVSQEQQEVVSDNAGTLPTTITKKAKLVVSASRCCHLMKYTSNSGLALSFSSANYRQDLPGSIGIAITKSDHLFHIYPFHNFW